MKEFCKNFAQYNIRLYSSTTAIWLSATRPKQLELCQNRALCVITGQLQATPVETLRRETGVCSMTTLLRRQTAIAYEKGFQVTRAYQATRPLTNWRKQLPPPLTRRHGPSHLPPRKPSSVAPSPIPCPTGLKHSWCTKISPGRQTA